LKACVECVEMRTALAEEFRTLQPLFAPWGTRPASGFSWRCWKVSRSGCGWVS